MLNDTTYDKVKLLYKLSKLCWLLEQHAIDNAEKEGDQETLKTLKELKKDLDKYVSVFEKLCR